QTAAVFAKDPVLKHKMWRALNTDEVAEPSAFAVDAAVAAFTEGAEWLDEMRAYVYENKQLLRDAAAKMPGVSVVDSDATYLLWLDVGGIAADSRAFARFRREKTGLILTPGPVYGTGGEHFLRWNAACPRSMMEDGLRRFREGVRLYRENGHEEA
ncbi:MAG: aminotransferase class I/II-fold pyridoxal phosphate-dependent enzyme, partial [Lachnospiraceae bacterium]|nr:aminotransferase class I/II-fold pyridoxal phosphate-dependent enzyme [Lachnospiraceae bacterium]